MFVIYIFTDSTRARFRGKRVKNIPRSWVWADRFPFNDLFHAIIYFIAWINVDSSLSRGHWKLENWKENDNFFFNFLEFSILQRKNFIYHSIKKKKIPSNFIDKFPVQQMFSRDHPFLSSRKSMLSHTIEYQKIDEENFFIIIFFFFFFFKFHTRSISKGNSAQVWGKFHWIFVHRLLRLFPSSHRWFTVLISHRIPENCIRRG